MYAEKFSFVHPGKNPYQVQLHWPNILPQLVNKVTATETSVNNDALFILCISAAFSEGEHDSAGLGDVDATTGVFSAPASTLV
mmetsp:Transcript_27036/g.43417  ORF Transcript_27036/g.43417 Transcript_27036/m.43417 type:complete len:83 (-) Transcript_27036:117-365(-)